MRMKMTRNRRRLLVGFVDSIKECGFVHVVGMEGVEDYSSSLFALYYKCMFVGNPLIALRVEKSAIRHSSYY